MQPTAFARNAIGEGVEDHRGWFRQHRCYYRFTLTLTCTADGKREVREDSLSYDNSREFIFG